MLHILSASYYPVPQISMPLSAAKFITSLPAESIPKEAEITMKESAEHYRLLSQRTVRSETTKDKVGALPPAVYEKGKTGTWSKLSFPDSCAKSSTALVSNESILLASSSDCTVVTFVVTRQFPKSTSPLSLNLSDGWIWKWLGHWLWWNRIRGDCRTQTRIDR